MLNEIIKEILKEELTGKKQTLELNQFSDHPFVVGKKYLIRTVTMIQTGQLKEVRGNFLVLKDADWIADTGRFSEALNDQSKFNEVEPFKNDAIVSMGSIVDATEIETLIRKLK